MFDIYLVGSVVYVTIYNMGGDGYTIYMDINSATELFASGLAVVESDEEKRKELVCNKDVARGIDAEAASLYYRAKWEESQNKDD